MAAMGGSSDQPCLAPRDGRALLLYGVRPCYSPPSAVIYYSLARPQLVGNTTYCSFAQMWPAVGVTCCCST
jgi:hypothetical protein